MKKFRCYFEVRGHSYRDVMADNREDAHEQVEGNHLELHDLEIAELESISVDDVEEVKPEQPKKKAKKK